MEGHNPHSLEYLPIFIHSESQILHYTCNSPSDRVLDKNNIKKVGDSFNCVNSNEVLKLPFGLYTKKGFTNISNKEILTLNLEKLLRDLK